MPRITASDLAGHQAALARSLVPGIRAGRTAIDRRISAALSHARNILTQALKDMPEGRPTIAKVGQSRSYAAALADIAELTLDLVAIVESSRVSWYEAAYEFWRGILPEAVLRKGLSLPPGAFVERARTAVVPAHGRPLRAELGAAARVAADGLRPALVRAGNKARTAAEAADALAVWASGSTSRIAGIFGRTLQDAVVLSDRIAGRDVLRPELLQPDPDLPEVA